LEYRVFSETVLVKTKLRNKIIGIVFWMIVLLLSLSVIFF
jgi:hypothetical protein